MTEKTCTYYDDTQILLLATRAIFDAYLPEWILNTYRQTNNFQQQILVNKPDVLLLDFSMPKYGGDIIISTMKPQLPKTLYIVFTADTTSEDIALYQELGFDSLIPKDIENTAFVNRFRAITNGQSIWT